ncbi:MAG: hypothetical protein WDW38_010121 [Sanguina aurantia]
MALFPRILATILLLVATVNASGPAEPPYPPETPNPPSPPQIFKVPTPALFLSFQHLAYSSASLSTLVPAFSAAVNNLIDTLNGESLANCASTHVTGAACLPAQIPYPPSTNVTVIGMLVTVKLGQSIDTRLAYRLTHNLTAAVQFAKVANFSCLSTVYIFAAGSSQQLTLGPQISPPSCYNSKYIGCYYDKPAAKKPVPNNAT